MLLTPLSLDRIISFYPKKTAIAIPDTIGCMIDEKALLEGIFQEIPALRERVGVYSISISSLKRLLKKDPRLYEDTFTPEEILYCNNNMLSLAGRFAAKKAIEKLLPTPLPLLHIQVLSKTNRQPTVTFANQGQSSSFSLSISHDSNIAIACAVSYPPKNPILVGLDILSTKRFSLPPSQLEKIIDFVFTKEEKKDCVNNTEEVAKKWAAKEAVLKAFGTGMWSGVLLKDVEIRNEGFKSSIQFSGTAADYAQKLSVHTWSLITTLSKNTTLALVFGFS